MLLLHFFTICIYTHHVCYSTIFAFAYECKRLGVIVKVSIPVSPSWPTHECHSLHEGIPLLLHEALPLHERGPLVSHEVLPLHKGGPLPLHEPLSLKPRRNLDYNGQRYIILYGHPTLSKRKRVCLSTRCLSHLPEGTPLILVLKIIQQL